MHYLGRYHERRKIAEICRKAAAIPKGVPGECERCGEDLEKLTEELAKALK